MSVRGFILTQAAFKQPLLAFKHSLQWEIHLTQIRVKTVGAVALGDQRCHLAQYVSLPPPPISSASVSALFHQILPTCSSALKMSHHAGFRVVFFSFFTISHPTVSIKALIQPCKQQG